MIRDNKPQYDEIKKAGRVGLPTVIIDNEIYITPEHGDLDKLL
ncbi:glutaredoxin-related protein [Alkaliphilus hydrothermalis]|uniref:Glutaredoxin-related protein n=1 Tax=Alkaliphilus hydrothermalis TaxID=1482730 RepID=A0ABS2NPU4_9FIRM|nr:glutaredoxin-related protein [Alkaliphilus hydrothermalis]